MDNQAPIPVPPHLQWREFRFKRLPFIFFLVGLFSVVIIWNRYVAAPNVVGEVETISTGVISILPGTLSDLKVEQFAHVTKDQVIGTIHPFDPDTLKASLAATEMELRVLRARMVLDRERNDLSYEQMNMDYLNSRLELAVARVDFQFAESELRRALKLQEQNIAAESEVDLARSVHDTKQQEVKELETLVARMEGRLKQLSPTGNEATDALEKSIAAEEAKILLTEGPITLRAPMDGIVSEIWHRNGEKVMGGVPIVTISSTKAERIMAFVRQPLTIIPKVGDVVHVRTRGSPRKMATAKVLHVGAELRTMISPLLVRGIDTMAADATKTDMALQRGLPFVVNLPEGLNLYPGEYVDLRIERNAN